jgi:hypothetical protein
MRITSLLTLLALAAFPSLAGAELSVPDTSTWYFHADFDSMRSSDAGKHLYDWLQREVFDDVREEAGIDLDKEADSITAFSATDSGTVVLIDGRISQDTQDKLLAIAAGSEELHTHEHVGKTFYFAKNDGGDDIEIDSFDGGVYFSFALRNRLLATSTREQMQTLLDNKGKLPKRNNTRGALVVLTAEKGLIQAGMQADQVDDDGDEGWQSNILRNTDQVALLIADLAGKIAIETRLVAKQPEMAESLASIVRGLISLTMFSDDMEPQVAELLQATNVEVDGSSLKIKVSMDPESLVSVLDD